MVDSSTVFEKSSIFVKRTFVVTFAAILGAWAMNGSAQERFSHPGRVVEIRTLQPAEVDVKAWSDSQETGDDECPKFGDALDSSTSNPRDGKFMLTVPMENPTYTVTYCAPHMYYPRADTALSNSHNNPVVPEPVELHRKDGDYTRSVRSKFIGLMNDLGYLYKINPDEFASVTETLVGELNDTLPERAEILWNLRELVMQWGEAK